MGKPLSRDAFARSLLLAAGTPACELCVTWGPVPCETSCNLEPWRFHAAVAASGSEGQQSVRSPMSCRSSSSCNFVRDGASGEPCSLGDSFARWCSHCCTAQSAVFAFSAPCRVFLVGRYCTGPFPSFVARSLARRGLFKSIPPQKNKSCAS